ncbi:caspase-3-like isoform X2 [Haliotis rubra]|uniref:caspase-3-like isoform X2 n=1 Tax=Haliotis rubra TaxID=36100 RepID=UPI001EE54FC6|nr:caspase-3-like isoform X2 [Haliotis rubra]
MSVTDSLRQRLLSISDGLTDDDVTHMKSLCLDVISRKEADDISSGFQLFELLETKGKLTDDYLYYVADLVKCVGQVCLLDHIDQGKTTFGKGRCHINTFRLYLTKLAMEIDDSEFKALKKSCNCNKEEITEFYQLMTFLENRKKITVRDISFLEEASKKAKLQGRIPSILQSFRDQLAYEADQYRITSDPKGICVIINNEKFTSGHHPDRQGTNVDAGKLERLFHRFKYKVERYNDCSAKQITDILKEISMRDHWRYDCFICCVLSHGTTGRVFGVDGMDVTISDLLELFFDSRCLSLAEKPKLFFFQACQGTATEGLKMDLPTTGVTADVLMDDKQPSAVDIEGNMLLGYATPPGFKSFRSGEDGSWYIEALVGSLKRSAARSLDIFHIFTEKTYWVF